LSEVLRFGDSALGQRGTEEVAALLARFGLELVPVAAGEQIPGSYWGESEAGLVGSTLFVRRDTPLHSVLHEAAHFVCMTDARRGALNRDAGGDDPEENAVCYLQIVLAGEIAAFGRERALADMDAWGYTFRLGAAGRWFAEDAADARIWLQRAHVLDAEGRVTFERRR
jgi:hypothetical protein